MGRDGTGRAGPGHRWAAWGGEREWGGTRWGGGGGGNGAGRDGAVGRGGVGQGVSGWGGMRWDEGEMGRSGAATPCCATCGAVLRRTRRATPRLLWRAGWIWGGMGWGGMGREVGRGGRGEGSVMEGGKWRDGGGMGEGWVRGRRWDGRRGSYVAHLQLTRRRCRRGWTPKRGAPWVERG
jgi:hypothetical protein